MLIPLAGPLQFCQPSLWLNPSHNDSGYFFRISISDQWGGPQNGMSYAYCYCVASWLSLCMFSPPVTFHPLILSSLKSNQMTIVYVICYTVDLSNKLKKYDVHLVQLYHLLSFLCILTILYYRRPVLSEHVDILVSSENLFMKHI